MRFDLRKLIGRGRPNIQALATRFTDVTPKTIEKWCRNWSIGAGTFPAAHGNKKSRWKSIVKNLQKGNRNSVRKPDHSLRSESLSADHNFYSELIPDSNYVEGAVTRVLVNRYERDPKARTACLKKHGCACSVCGLDFMERYGGMGKGFIHVHHNTPLALRKAEYQLNPAKDLVPVCPNCHAMLHYRRPWNLPLSTDELRKIWQEQNGK